MLKGDTVVHVLKINDMKLLRMYIATNIPFDIEEQV